MDARQFGAYMLLLMYYWNHSCLPAEANMPRVARVDAKAWRSMKDIVLPRVQEDIIFLDQEKNAARSSSKERTRRYRQRMSEQRDRHSDRHSDVTTRSPSECECDSECITTSEIASKSVCLSQERTNDFFHRQTAKPRLALVGA